MVHLCCKQIIEGDEGKEKKMNDEDFEKIWYALDNRITTINDRTKAHTIEIRELKKKIKELKNE